MVVGVAERRPGQRADLRTGDVVLGVGGDGVATLPGFFRKVWSLGDAGVTVPLTVSREGETIELRVASADRSSFLKAPSLH